MINHLNSEYAKIPLNDLNIVGSIGVFVTQHSCSKSYIFKTNCRIRSRPISIQILLAQ